MYSLLLLVSSLVEIFIWVIIAHAVLSWLVAFQVVNTHNRVVYTLLDLLARLVDPLLSPVRRFLPSLGGIDLSPVILILALVFLRNLMWEFFGGVVPGP